jgi:circadian clock protein KaiC
MWPHLDLTLPKCRKTTSLKIDHVHIDKTEIEETGEYDLDGLFIRLGHAIDTIKAITVVVS